jgi:hypothetical protein
LIHPALVKKGCSGVTLTDRPLENLNVIVFDILQDTLITFPSPVAQSILSPGRKVSIGFSPSGVKTIVPAEKHSSMMTRSAAGIVLLASVCTEHT